MSVPAFTAIVRGRVQGVGFRQYVTQCAQNYDITGFARNCPDGTVEVQAFGPHTALEKFLTCLGKGPTMARVTTVDVTWHEDKSPPTAFVITH